MKISLLLSTVALFAGITSSAADAPAKAADAPTKAETTGGASAAKKAEPGHLRRAIYKATGGKVIKPGTMQGSVAYVNAQKSIPAAWIEQNAAAMENNLKIRTVVENGSFDFPKVKVYGSLCVYIIDDPEMPNLLTALENRWAMVNLAPLKAGKGSKEAFLRARFQKELTRALCMMLGAHNSQQPNSLLSCITDSAKLDDYVNAAVPYDIPNRIKTYVGGYGIIPGVETTYRKACQEGWAPAPTNAIQQAIWDKVHELPKNPIKILPETKPVKE